MFEKLPGNVLLYKGDCLKELEGFNDNHFDACVTDPPYHLQSIHKRFAAKGRDETSERYAAGPYGRTAKGFMGRTWDGGDVAFQVETWAAVYRVLKPGSHLVAFGGTRTYHRMACAIEDAGFEIRDQLQWLYGSGFPKSHDVSKGIDRAAGVEREVVGSKLGRPGYSLKANDTSIHNRKAYGDYVDAEAECVITAATTDEALQWSGWGTALKPACEPIVLARKPLSEGTVVANVLKWGTGALNIDGCRVETEPRNPGFANRLVRQNSVFGKDNRSRPLRDEYDTTTGRWPANVILDGSEEVVGAFPEIKSPQTYTRSGDAFNQGVYGAGIGKAAGEESLNFGDSGSAARFFYTSKADADDRLGSSHPTVKPLDLMQWLVRLVTPPKGLILDPFAGTGTTGEAAFREGMRSVLIEREPEYQEDIRRRIKFLLANPERRQLAAVQARGAKNNGLRSPFDLFD